MTPENPNLPDWARQERQSDLEWIKENLDLFEAAAAGGRSDVTRGAIVVDATRQFVPGAGHPFAYFGQEEVEQYANEDTRRMVAEYDPTQELVLVLLKPGERTSTYRVCTIPPDQEGTSLSRTEQRAARAELEVPDVETLIEWEEEGGCEAACPYHCWVEPDGVCPHGNPSWLIRLGLI